MPIHLQVNYEEPDGRMYKVYGNDYKKGKILAPTKFKGQAMMYVMPCKDHVNGVSVPVVVVSWDPIEQKNDILGNAKACPLCWEVIKVVDGEALKKLFGD